MIRNFLSNAENLQLILDESDRELSTMRRRQADLVTFRAKIERFERDHSNLLEENENLLEEINLSKNIVKINIDYDALDKRDSELKGRISVLYESIYGGVRI